MSKRKELERREDYALGRICSDDSYVSQFEKDRYRKEYEDVRRQLKIMDEKSERTHRHHMGEDGTCPPGYTYVDKYVQRGHEYVKGYCRKNPIKKR